ncbi:hypothetical protein OU426_08760 [Frigidibacter sp. RF13]|uniref:hypothetical protein n=1 Tax=Frigidibacter sp. RF13 TaxID=2997340 RepID=UPI00226D7AE5|nr:hypothetical protein [Frigidibacter sp. RF13]MCY1126943.1 hypothetical protein [Frigidibacter sp. RF13]
MRIAVSLGLALIGGGAAFAEPEALTGEASDKAVTGRTFHYRAGPSSFGTEQYLPGRRVVWAYTGDDCVKGIWYPEGGDICFLYEGQEEPVCWSFAETDAGLVARSLGNPDLPPLTGRQTLPDALACLGPDVGV